MEGTFHQTLKEKIHQFVSLCYRLAKQFPPDERFGLVSQLRRAAMSVMLNYVEGYARRREKVKLNFYEISYGSLQECKYILYFVHQEKWVSTDQYKKIISIAEEISKMLWSTIDGLERKIGR